MNIQTQIPKRHKWFFWIILGALSTVFAEVVSGSDLLPFFHVWGLIVELPLYMLHILVLAYVVFHYGRPRFSTLFLAGAIFGLYEAYITKVLWNPPWDEMINVGGVALFEIPVLVLWWHPFMAFIVPLLVGETALTSTRETINALPGKARRLLTTRNGCILLAALGGLFQGSNSPSLEHILLSGAANAGILGLLLVLWRRISRGQTYDIHDLLPNKREFGVLLALLLALYLLAGFFLRPEALPGLFPQMVIWLLYGAFFTLLYLNLRKTRQDTPPDWDSFAQPFSRLFGCFLVLIFVMTSAATHVFLSPLSNVIMLIAWVIGAVVGIFSLVWAVRDLF